MPTCLPLLPRPSPRVNNSLRFGSRCASQPARHQSSARFISRSTHSPIFFSHTTLTTEKARRKTMKLIALLSILTLGSTLSLALPEPQDNDYRPPPRPSPRPRYPPCGGLLGIQCPSEKQVCIDNPWTCSQAVDCAGICVYPTFCGGIAGFPCPKGQTCVDDPRDDCDPNNGGADCGGLCV